MCGIAGWVAFGRDIAEQGAVVERMTRTLSQRGPDAWATWSGRHIALGHHRLAVVDLPGGAQPMVRGLVTLTYSGEVYNFTELRETLRAKGHRFHTHSDTEVVLVGYLEWGERVVDRLNGMYAFALWDARETTLLLVRDRLGIKPLYYMPLDDGVLFGSEAKAILAHPSARRVLDLDGLRTIIGYALRLPGSPWCGIAEVPPGAVMTVAPEGIRTRTYWKLDNESHSATDPTGHVRHLLEDIVGRQLVADVPLCVLLSGGLDSSALAALAAGKTEQLRTVAVDFKGHDKNFVPSDHRPTRDAPYVRMMVDHLGTDHHDVVVDPAELASPGLRERAVLAYDMPPGSGDRDRSLLLLFQAVREFSTVALSGESADELFGGYEWFHNPADEADMFSWISFVANYTGFTDVLHEDLARALDLNGFLAQRYADAVSGIPCGQRMRVTSHLHLTHHLRVLLDRKDRLSMANGLEVRVPYCDHRLVEYVYSLPWEKKSFDGREKSLLRAAVRDLLPPKVADRVKSAYPTVGAPEHDCVLREQVGDLAATPNHPVFSLVKRPWLASTVGELTAKDRKSVEWVLNLASWLQIYRPELRLT